MRFATRGVLCAAICTSFAGSATAATVLTFEGLQNFEQVADYYDGGLGSLGSGPGPDYGVTFDPLALAYIPGLQKGHITPFPGDPSPPTVLLLFDPSNPYGAGVPTSTTMDVSPGFADQLAFYYIAIGRQATVQIFSGPDGTGTLLAQQTFPITPESFAAAPSIMNFSSIAHSVVFAGGNDQLALDNILFTSVVPEPSSWFCLAAGLAGSLLIVSRRRMMATSR